MNNSFKIIFDFNLDDSSRILHMQGEVELHHSVPHYMITGIHKAGNTSGSNLLPDMDIKCILAEGARKWVHTDSGKETYLSTAIGQGIEKIQPTIEIAEADEEAQADEY